MGQARDMNGKIIKTGMMVNKHSIINDKTSSFRKGIVSNIGPMHRGGENMVWAGPGGAHHPKACVITKEKP